MTLASLLAALLLLAGLAPPALAWQEEQAPEAPAVYGATPEAIRPYRESGEPYWRFFDEPTRFLGPGREKAAPADLASVRLGLMVPLEGAPDASIGESVLAGVRLRLEQANAGREGPPFELIVRNDAGAWGASSNTLVELAWDEGVWAVLGSVDGSSTHVALRAALKAEVVMVNTACTDPTLTETAIPWLLRCYPDDRQYGYRLARFVYEERGHERVAMLRSNDKYGRMGVGEFNDASRRLNRPIVVEQRYFPGERDFSGQLERIATMRVDAVVLWSSAADAAAIVRQLRESGLQQPVYGSERLVSDEFLAQAGPHAEGVVAVCPLDPGRDDPHWLAFRDAYRARFEREPDAFAAFSYDGASLVLDAMARAGLNRALIRDELAQRTSWNGVAGPMTFDATHNNLGPIHVLQVNDGRFVRIAGP